MKLSRLLLWGLLVVLLGTIAMMVLSAIVPFTLGEPGDWLAVGGTAGLHLLSALVCALARERGRARMWMYSGIIAIGISLAFSLTAFVAMNVMPYLPWRMAIWPVCWGGLMTAVAILLQPHARSGWWHVVRQGTIGLLALLALEISIAYAAYPDCSHVSWDADDPRAWRDCHDLRRDFEESALKIGSVLSLLASGGMAALFISLVVPGLAPPPRHIGEPRAFRFECPRCSTWQNARTGDHHCTSCGLRVEVLPL